MANKEQKANREKRKPKAEKPKTVAATSMFSSADAKAKGGGKK